MVTILAYGCCGACGTPISFNPDYVPSIRVDGSKQPLCQACFAQWNAIHRTAKGLEPLELHPMAYQPQPDIG
jgi:hypothetical protein